MSEEKAKQLQQTIDQLMYEVEQLKQKNKKLKAKKKYGLVWEIEKDPEQVVLDCQTKLPILRANQKMINTDDSKPVNILIEGDNYHALSVLNYTHKEKIDVIYIDPPYNTGNKEWKYNDDWVDREDAYRHSKWLALMEKRLRLAKNLLTDEGVIFISIDHNELAQLRILCDEIFFEKNFVGILIWRKKSGGGQADQFFATEHEYILAYSKANNFKWLEETIPDDGSKYNKEDKDGKYCAVKLAKWGNTARKEDRPTMSFPIKSPDNTNVYPIAPDSGDGRWRVGKIRMDELIKDGLIEWQKKDKTWIPYEKIYTNGEEVKKIKERSIIYELASTADGSNELTRIFGIKDIFPNPKPKDLIKYLLAHSTEKDAKILDFFAGSGTTAHAVLDLNRDDNGQRQFILCTNNELNEKTEKDFEKRGIKKGSPEYEREGICQKVCYPRIEKVIKGYKDPKSNLVEGLKGNLRFFKTEFIDVDHVAAVSDEQRIRLTYGAGEMIALRENTFDEVEKNEWWQIFTSGKKYTAIYFKEDKTKLNGLVEKLSKHKEKVALYIFSWGKNEYKSEFSEYKNIKILDIPEPIIEVYKGINSL